MPGQPSQNMTATSSIFELKGSTFALPVLRLLGTDQETLSKELSERIHKAPEFFQNAPLVIDLRAATG